jgi:N-acetylglucosaminyl-diphospho-decaprenol L-rhamnosyltransferase
MTASQRDAHLDIARPGAPESVDCGIVIVTYNSARHVGRLLDSIPAAAGGLTARCLVVDNASHDDTVAIVRARGDAEVIEAGRNLGYAGAINIGRSVLRSCSAIVILNADLVLEDKALVALYNVLDQPGVGVAVPTLRNMDGSPYPALRREPSVSRAIGDALFGGHLAWRPGWLSETLRDPADYQHPRDVDWSGGAALLVSSACDQAVGAWDASRFFLYSEETDFARRARECGFRIRHVPAAVIRHEDGGSGRSLTLAKLLAVNRVRYYEKYHGRVASMFFRAAVALHYLLRSSDSEQRKILAMVVRRTSWADLSVVDAR